MSKLIAFANSREEEMMRHASFLLNEAKAHPQFSHVLILFETVEEGELLFRLLVSKRKDNIDFTSIEKIDSSLFFIPERVKAYGKFELNHHFLKVSPRTEDFLFDRSLHVDLVRKRIVEALIVLLGPIRDANGSLFKKKEENLKALTLHFPEQKKEVIEEFFYSLHPEKSQATLDSIVLRDFFAYCLKFRETAANPFSQKRFANGYFGLCYKDNDPLAIIHLKRELYQNRVDLHSMTIAKWKNEKETHFFFLL